MKKTWCLLFVAQVSLSMEIMPAQGYGWEHFRSEFCLPENKKQRDDLSKIKKIRKEKKDFERRLHLEKVLEREKKEKSCIYGEEAFTVQLFSPQEVDKAPETFLQYIYYHIFWKYEYSFHLNYLKMKNFTDLLIKVKEVQVDGFSALGAALIAKETKHEDKKEIINELLTFNFVPTEKDKELAYLEWFDSEPWPYAVQARWLLLLGHKKNPASLFANLPLELIKFIASFLRCESKPLL